MWLLGYLLDTLFWLNKVFWNLFWMTHFPEEKERILVNNWKLQVVLGSSCGNPTLVDTTLLTGGLLWQEHLLSSPGDLLLRPHPTGLQKPGSRNFSVDFRQIATKCLFQCSRKGCQDKMDNGFPGVCFFVWLTSECYSSPKSSPLVD